MPDSPSQERVWDLMERLRRDDREFCAVTVVRTADLTSAKAGAKAVVTADGELHGFIGGACVSGAAARAAQAALASGKARMVRVKPKERARQKTDADGVEVHPSSCPSGGAADLFVEPMRRPPRLVVCGESPAASALRVLGRTLGFRIVWATAGGPGKTETDPGPGSDSDPGADLDPGAGSDGRKKGGGADGVGGMGRMGGVGGVGVGADLRIRGWDLSELQLDSRDAVVAATQGRGDAAALAGALASGAGYAGMICSRRKAAALRKKLGGDFPPSRLAELRAPAGLDIGGMGPEEIALSILAEIVRDRRAGGKARPGPESSPPVPE